ncbi:unnamed protein product, partial [Ectocarpus sp. 8 AP-2014]
GCGVGAFERREQVPQAYGGTPGWCIGTPVAASVPRYRNRWTLSKVGLRRAIARGEKIHARNAGAVKVRTGQDRPGRAGPGRAGPPLLVGLVFENSVGVCVGTSAGRNVPHRCTG